MWFLVHLATGAYIGPLPEVACQRAAVELMSAAVVCKPSLYAYACAIDGQPGGVRVCYKFDIPQVTVKP